MKILQTSDSNLIFLPICVTLYETEDMKMANQEYISRLFDKTIEFVMKSKGALVIVGPKWCGKSTTAKRYAKTIIDLMPLETRKDYIDLAKVAPGRLLNIGMKPILIDEWQHISFIWDQIKYEIDKTGEFGQYILTGSVTDKSKDDMDEVTTFYEKDPIDAVVDMIEFLYLKNDKK